MKLFKRIALIFVFIFTIYMQYLMLEFLYVNTNFQDGMIVFSGIAFIMYGTSFYFIIAGMIITFKGIK